MTTDITLFWLSKTLLAQEFYPLDAFPLAPTHTLEGWKTSIFRKQLGLEKNKDDKSVKPPKTIQK